MNHIECLLRGKPSVNVYMPVTKDKVGSVIKDKVEPTTKDKVESVTIHIMMFGNGYDDPLDMEIEGSICGTTISSRSAAIIKDDTISKHLGSNNLLLEITGNIEGEDSATILRPVKITAIMTEITPETKEFGAMEVSKCQIIISGNLRHDNTASTYDVEDGIIMSPGIPDATQSRVTASEASPGSERLFQQQDDSHEDGLCRDGSILPIPDADASNYWNDDDDSNDDDSPWLASGKMADVPEITESEASPGSERLFQQQDDSHEGGLFIDGSILPIPDADASNYSNDDDDSDDDDSPWLTSGKMADVPEITESEASPGSESSTLPAADLNSAKSTEKRQEEQANGSNPRKRKAYGDEEVSNSKRMKTDKPLPQPVSETAAGCSTLPAADLNSAKSTEKRQESQAQYLTKPGGMITQLQGSQAQYLILLKYIIEQESVNIGDQDDICYNAVLAFLSMCGVDSRQELACSPEGKLYIEKNIIMIQKTFVLIKQITDIAEDDSKQTSKSDQEFFEVAKGVIKIIKKIIHRVIFYINHQDFSIPESLASSIQVLFLVDKYLIPSLLKKILLMYQEDQEVVQVAEGKLMNKELIRQWHSLYKSKLPPKAYWRDRFRNYFSGVEEVPCRFPLLDVTASCISCITDIMESNQVALQQNTSLTQLVFQYASNIEGKTKLRSTILGMCGYIEEYKRGHYCLPTYGLNTAVSFRALSDQFSAILKLTEGIPIAESLRRIVTLCKKDLRYFRQRATIENDEKEAVATIFLCNIIVLYQIELIPIIINQIIDIYQKIDCKIPIELLESPHATEIYEGREKMKLMDTARPVATLKNCTPPTELLVLPTLDSPSLAGDMQES